MFGNKKLNEEISNLKSEVLKLEKTIEAKDVEIEFYKIRGDKYLNGLDTRDKQSTELFNLAKEIMIKLADNSAKK